MGVTLRLKASKRSISGILLLKEWRVGFAKWSFHRMFSFDAVNQVIRSCACRIQKPDGANPKARKLKGDTNDWILHEVSRESSLAGGYFAQAWART